MAAKRAPHLLRRNWTMVSLSSSPGSSRNQSPNHEYKDGAHHAADQAGFLVGPVPSNGLPQIGRGHGADDTERRRQDESTRLVRGPGMQQLRKRPGDEADD